MNTPKNYRWRKFVDQVMRGSTVVATGCAVIPLIAIIGYVLTLGASALSVQFFSDVYQPPNMAQAATDGTAPAFDPNDPFAGIGVPTDGTAPVDGAAPTSDVYAGGPVGGVLHGIIGTLIITGMGLLFALPIGIFAGIYLSEYRNERYATMVRFCCDVLSGSPSIVAGVVIYILVVIRTHEFSAIAGSLALMILMIPIVTRTTEEMLKLVPESMREAARGLGAPTWYSTFTVIIPAALPGIVTGVMLAFARGAGETAPLILTVLGSNVITTNLFAPMASLPLLAYRYTESPYPGENTLAWGAAFVLMMLVLCMNILVRVATRRRAGASR
ncbi:MAG: phosphate ABC transporter permease PstA [Chloroflexales bacterium]|nr:phosphate ABC transporter permease PstA [Chloroflexales bacterium]